MNARRVAVIAKYEVKQYLKSHFSAGSVIGICLVAVLLLLTPGVERVELPSAQKLYRVGFYQQTRVVGYMEQSFPFRMVRFPEIVAMVEALQERDVDSGLIIQDNVVNVLGSGTLKSDGAINRLQEEFTYINNQQIRETIRRQPELAGILLPLSIRVIEEEIDYDKIINGSLDVRRRRFLAEKQQDTIQSILEGGGEAEIEAEGIRLTATGSGKADGGADAEADEVEGVDAAGVAGPSSQREVSISLPDELNVEFPFMNLFRNMMMLAPSVILSLMFSLSLIREKVDRSLNNLFSAPVSKFDIIAGKSLPYLALIGAINVVYGCWIADGLEAVKVMAIFLSVSAVILATGLFSVVVSRSYRELTFIGSFYIFIFLFMIVLPNVFAGINALALISPVSHITSIEAGASVSWLELLLSLLPYHTLTLSFVAFTLLTFDAEVLFSNWRVRDIVEHYYIMLGHLLSSTVSYVAVAVALLVPFVFLVESIFSYLILPLGRFSAIVSLLIFAGIEEVAKIIPFAAAHRRDINPAVYGVVAGTSFFVTERVFNSYFIAKIFSFFGGPYLYFIAKGLAATWAVHIITVGFLAVAVKHLASPAQKWLVFILVVLLHFIYNLNLVYQVF